MSILFALGFYLCDFLFTFVLYLLWLRIGVRYFRVSFDNPVVQTILAWTNPLIRPFNWIFKALPKGPYDWSAFALIIVLDIIKLYVLIALGYGLFLPPLIAGIRVLGDLVIFPCQILFYALLIRVMMSWAPQFEMHPVNRVACIFTDSFMYKLNERGFRAAGLDFTPLVWMLILKGVEFVVYASMPLHLV